MIICSCLLAGVALLLAAAAHLGLLYIVVACVLGARLMQLATRVNREDRTEAARRLYSYSIMYIAVLFGAMILDRIAKPL